MKKQTHFPKGWDEARVQRVLERYDAQTDEEAVAEDEAAFGKATHTAMKVPVALVAEVRKLLAKHRLPNRRIQPARRRAARG
jgi:hypothetical protein